MTEKQEIRVPFDPTDAEVMRGAKLACRPLYQGRWRVAIVTYSLVQGLASGVGFIMVSYLLARIFAEIPGSGFILMYLFFIIFSFAYWILERRIKRRGAKVYRASLIMRGQELCLTPIGITFDNGRSRSFFDWRDIGTVIAAKDMIVATVGYQGIVVPDRMLAQTGEPETLRAQVMTWHMAAKAAE